MRQRGLAEIGGRCKATLFPFISASKYRSKLAEIGFTWPPRATLWQRLLIAAGALRTAATRFPGADRRRRPGTGASSAGIATVEMRSPTRIVMMPRFPRSATT